MKSLEQLQIDCFESLNNLNLEVHEENYKQFNKHREHLKKLASFKNSRITVYDIHKHNYIFYENNLSHILSNEFENSNIEDSQHIMSIIHPEDLKLILTASIKANEFYQTQKKKISTARRI